MLTSDQEEILDLRDKVWELQELNKNLLESVVDMGACFPKAWGLYRQEAKALIALWMADDYVSLETLHFYISPKARWGIVAVVLAKLRKKLPPEIVIISHHGQGYEIPISGKALLSIAVTRRLNYFQRIPKKSLTNRSGNTTIAISDREIRT